MNSKLREINRKARSRINHDKYRREMDNFWNCWELMNTSNKEVKGKLIPENVEVFETKRTIKINNMQLFMIAQFVVIIVLILMVV